jgi:hypothetical protein
MASRVASRLLLRRSTAVREVLFLCLYPVGVIWFDLLGVAIGFIWVVRLIWLDVSSGRYKRYCIYCCMGNGGYAGGGIVELPPMIPCRLPDCVLRGGLRHAPANSVCCSLRDRISWYLDRLILRTYSLYFLFHDLADGTRTQIFISRWGACVVWLWITIIC